METFSWHIPFRQGWIIRVWDRNMHICVTVAEHSMYRSRIKRQWTALMELCELEGIIPAIESAHAMAYAFKKAKEMRPEQSMIVCLSGRGDKDVNTIANYLAGKGYLN